MINYINEENKSINLRILDKLIKTLDVQYIKY